MLRGSSVVVVCKVEVVPHSMNWNFKLYDVNIDLVKLVVDKKSIVYTHIIVISFAHNLLNAAQNKSNHKLSYVHTCRLSNVFQLFTNILKIRKHFHSSLSCV